MQNVEQNVNITLLGSFSQDLSDTLKNKLNNL